MSVRYKFVELSTVTDVTIERTVNEWTAQGWVFDTIHFVTRDNSPRPCMAFLSFTREAPEPDADAEG
jgi:hypothetical protein